MYIVHVHVGLKYKYIQSLPELLTIEIGRVSLLGHLFPPSLEPVNKNNNNNNNNNNKQ